LCRELAPVASLPVEEAASILARVPSPRDLLRAVREELRQTFLERDELIDGALVALVAAQHVLVIGPPGTAKSMLADEVCRRLTDARYFQWLLTRFTTPEELFGAVSLKALEADDYRRLTTHKLPEAHIAFLDEVFKASSSILNTILTLMNERRFHNGREIVDVPLLTLFAASNELPEDDELLALNDRFLLRFVVDYVEEDFRFLKLLQPRPSAGRTTLPLDRLAEARAEAAALPVPGEVLRALADVRRELRSRGIVASDRRWAQSVDVLRAHAYLAGRDAVADEDVAFLEHVLWRDPAERAQVRAVIRELLRGYEDEVRVLLYQSRELHEYAVRTWDTRELQSRAAVEAHTKIRNILDKVDLLLAQAEGGGRPVERALALRREIADLERDVLGRL
jgi:MoxR-like ATPase